MLVFVASMGPDDDDFCYTVTGELVRPCTTVCDADLNGDGGCGCGRAWAGLASGTATTVAVVAERALTPEIYAELIGDADMAEWLQIEAVDFGLGTYVRHETVLDDDDTLCHQLTETGVDG